MRHRFIDGVVLSTDAWRVVQLQLLAVAQTGDIKILEDPAAIIQLANEIEGAQCFPDLFGVGIEGGDFIPGGNRLSRFH